MFVAICTLAGVLVTSVASIACAAISHRSHRSVKEINDAVNHRHEKKGPDAPKLYDLIWENHEKSNELIEWKRGYDDGPLGTGGQVDRFVEKTNRRLDRLEQQSDECDC